MHDQSQGQGSRAAGGQQGKKNQGKRWRNNWRVKEKRAFAEENANLVIEESKLSVKELQSLRQAEKRLKKDEVYSLTKVFNPSRSNPGALYACALCDFLLDSLSDAYRHIRDRRHKKRVREKQEEAMLTEIPPPGPEQVSAVTSALEAVMQEHGIKDQDVENRRSAVSIMQELLQSVLPEEIFAE
uniref:C2H2-type domain-containing protein n=1 Tax=Oryzias melastigma TaxID=30732 RepID=A0A3B3C8F9_ORYME